MLQVPRALTHVRLTDDTKLELGVSVWCDGRATDPAPPPVSVKCKWPSVCVSKQSVNTGTLILPAP